MKTYGPVRVLASEVWRRLDEKRATPPPHAGRGRTDPSLLSLEHAETVQLEGEEAKLFLTERPLAGNEAEITLRRLQGCARLSVTVCKIDRNLQVTELWQLSFAKNRALQRPIVKRLSGVQDHLVSIYVVCSSPARRCHLRLTLTGTGSP